MKIFPVLITACLLLQVFPAYASDRGGIIDGGDMIFLAGYGVTHPGLGLTRTHVETVDLIPRYEHRHTGEIGRSWWRGHHALFVEMPVHVVVDPDFAPIAGLNFLAAWVFEPRGRIVPYFFGGGGPLYSWADIDGVGADVNGNWQFGGGIEYNAGKELRLRFEYRFHHISNAGAKDPNVPLNSSKLLMGFVF